MISGLLESLAISDIFLMRLSLKILVTIFVWIAARAFVKIGHKTLLGNRKVLGSLEKCGLEYKKVRSLDALLDITVYILAFMTTLYIFELTSVIYTMLTAAGVIGIVIGFAVREVAANGISGLILEVTQPFYPGHFISLEGGESGTVKGIGGYATKIQRLDGIEVIVPNSKLINRSVTNFSTAKERMADIKICISPGTDITKAINVLKESAENEGSCLKEKPIDVFVDDIKEYYLILNLRVWMKREEFWPAKRRLMLQIVENLKKENVKLAVPMRRNVVDEYA